MKYNILGFQQDKLVREYGQLNGNDVIVLRTMADILSRMTRTITVGEIEYVQMTYDLLLEDVPFVTQSKNTIKKIVEKLINAGLVERHFIRKGGNFTYFRMTEKFYELCYQKQQGRKEQQSCSSSENETNDCMERVEEELQFGSQEMDHMIKVYGIEDVMLARQYVYEKVESGTHIRDACKYLHHVLHKGYYDKCFKY